MGGILRTTSVSQRDAHAWMQAQLISAIPTLKWLAPVQRFRELPRNTTTPTIATATGTKTITSMVGAATDYLDF
jgi:hypothetical protein